MAVNISGIFGLHNIGLPKDDDHPIVPDHDDPLAQHNLHPSRRPGGVPSDTFHGPIPGIHQPTDTPPNGRKKAPLDTYRGPIPGIRQPGNPSPSGLMDHPDDAPMRRPDDAGHISAPTDRPDSGPSDTFHGRIPGFPPLDNRFPSDREDNPDSSKSSHLDNATSDTVHGPVDRPDTSFDSRSRDHPVDNFANHCNPKCKQETVCSLLHNNKWQCVCEHSFSPPRPDGTCHNGHILPPDPQPKHNRNLTDDVVRPHVLDTIVNGNKTETTSPTLIKRAPDWRVLQIALPVGVFLFLFFVVILLFMRKWRNSRNSKRGSDGVVKNSDNVQLLERMNIISKNPTYFTSLQDGAEGKELYVREIPLEHLHLVDVVGEGAFGQVFKGNLFNTETNCESKVAVKVLKEGVCNEIREDFEREVEIMSAFDHDNILRLIGVVTQNVGESPYMVFEYMEYGDLAELLRKNDPILRKTDDCIVLQKNDLIDISTQIAKGMAYLTSQHFVHRDLATRNCLVGEGLVVKISDFGMSRDIYTCDYYKIGGSRMLPVRWMSPESVKYGRFTSESDVWAFGVVLWEIFSCGRQPYYGHSNEEVIRFLDEKIYLQRPEDCPNVVYNLMIGCWRQEPKERFTFEKIQNLLEENSKKVVLTDAEQKSIDAVSINEVVT